VASTGSVEGAVTTPRMVIAEGATLDGRVTIGAAAGS
jgi:cytoskeletal protein CcmA (bactofilin family)